MWFLILFFLIVCSIVDQQQNPEEYVNIIVEPADCGHGGEFAYNSPQNNEDDGKKNNNKNRIVLQENFLMF